MSMCMLHSSTYIHKKIFTKVCLLCSCFRDCSTLFVQTLTAKENIEGESVGALTRRKHMQASSESVGEPLLGESTCKLQVRV